MRNIYPAYTLGKNHKTITSPDGTSVLHAKEVDDNDADCCGCYFRNRKCPDTGLGRGAACTPDVRSDEKTIVWQVVP